MKWYDGSLGGRGQKRGEGRTVGRARHVPLHCRALGIPGLSLGHKGNFVEAVFMINWCQTCPLWAGMNSPHTSRIGWHDNGLSLQLGSLALRKSPRAETLSPSLAYVPV